MSPTSDMTAPVGWRALRWRLWALVVVMVIIAVPSGAWGAKAPSKAPLKVGYLPLKLYTVSPKGIFRKAKKPAPFTGEAAKVDELLTACLASHDDLSVVAGKQMKKAMKKLPNFMEYLFLANQNQNLGKKSYDALKLDDALGYFEDAEKTFEAKFVDAIEPHLLAEVKLYKALSLIDEGKDDLAHIELREMFGLNPTVTFKKGYYPKNVEKKLRAAVMDMSLSVTKGSVAFPMSPERVTTLLGILDMDVLITGYVTDDDGGPEVTILVHDKRTKGVVFKESFPLSDDEGALAEHVDRLVSRWLACQTFKVIKPKRFKKKSLFLSSSFATAVYVKYPIQNPFVNFGFQLGGAYELVSNLEVFGTFEVLSSYSDVYRDLIGTFSSVRGIVGVGFNIQRNWFHAYLRPALDLHYLGSFTYTRDPDCKFFGADHPLCGSGAIDDLGVDVMAGVNVSAGLDIFLLDTIYLAISASLSTYFYPLSQELYLNFPVSGGIGLGYAF